MQIWDHRSWRKEYVVVIKLFIRNEFDLNQKNTSTFGYQSHKEEGNPMDLSECSASLQESDWKK